MKGKKKSEIIYKQNCLNNASYINFTLTGYNIFLYILSQVKNVDFKGKDACQLDVSHIQREYRVTAQDIQKALGKNLSHCYVFLKQTADRLIETNIKIRDQNSKNYIKVNVCSKAHYVVTEGAIEIKFTDDIIPYLKKVKNRFVLYNLKEITSFKSLYSVRLYEVLQGFKTTGWMLKTLTQMRDIFATEDKYLQYKNFKNKVLTHAVNEINSVYENINLNFQEIKISRKVTSLKFFFNPQFSVGENKLIH